MCVCVEIVVSSVSVLVPTDLVDTVLVGPFEDVVDSEDVEPSVELEVVLFVESEETEVEGIGFSSKHGVPLIMSSWNMYAISSVLSSVRSFSMMVCNLSRVPYRAEVVFNASTCLKLSWLMCGVSAGALWCRPNER